jgi:hypothetical protein
MNFETAGNLVTNFLVILLTFAGLATGVAQTAAVAENNPDYSGMYAFLQEGEFVQLTVEDHGMVTGFVSRFKEGDGEKTFVDHFFKNGRLDGKKLVFTTEVAQNISYEFNGTIERGEGKKPDEEGYYILHGTLTESKVSEDKKTTTQSQPVTLKSFPQDAEVSPPK